MHFLRNEPNRIYPRRLKRHRGSSASLHQRAIANQNQIGDRRSTTMEKHIENLLNKISIACVTVGTVTLLFLFLRTPQTCIPPNTPTTKPHLKFPSSTCDSSLLRHRPYLPLSKRNRRLWSSHSWISAVNSYSSLFRRLPLRNHSHVLCVSAGAGHEVMALNRMGVVDITGVELVDSLPLVRKADPHNLPFFDGVFDLAFTARLEESLFPARFVGEMERTVRGGGVVVVALGECGHDGVKQIVGLFKRSEFVSAVNVTLVGARMTTFTMRVGHHSS